MFDKLKEVKYLAEITDLKNLMMYIEIYIIRQYWHFQSKAKLEQIIAIVITHSVFLFYISKTKKCLLEKLVQFTHPSKFCEYTSRYPPPDLSVKVEGAGGNNFVLTASPHSQLEDYLEFFTSA